MESQVWSFGVKNGFSGLKVGVGRLKSELWGPKFGLLGGKTGGSGLKVGVGGLKSELWGPKMSLGVPKSDVGVPNLVF